MKRNLLTLAAVAAFATGAHGQAALALTDVINFNTITSSSSAASGWYTGKVTMDIYTIPAAGHASLANTINADEQSIATEASGNSLIEEDFTQQDFGTVGGPMSSEASSQTLQNSDGSLAVADQGVRYVGTSATLPQTTDIYFALLFTDPYNLAEGAVVLNEPATGYFPSITPPSSASNEYPLDDQNIILVPEPTALALAGLGGLSLLSLRRRNTQKSGAW